MRLRRIPNLPTAHAPGTAPARRVTTTALAAASAVALAAARAVVTAPAASAFQEPQAAGFSGASVDLTDIVRLTPDAQGKQTAPQLTPGKNGQQAPNMQIRLPIKSEATASKPGNCTVCAGSAAAMSAVATFSHSDDGAPLHCAFVKAMRAIDRSADSVTLVCGFSNVTSPPSVLIVAVAGVPKVAPVDTSTRSLAVTAGTLANVTPRGRVMSRASPGCQVA
jgi:hypothetical protein